MNADTTIRRARHRTGRSVPDTITLAYLRDPEVFARTVTVMAMVASTVVTTLVPHAEPADLWGAAWGDVTTIRDRLEAIA